MIKSSIQAGQTKTHNITISFTNFTIFILESDINKSFPVFSLVSPKGESINSSVNTSNRSFAISNKSIFTLSKLESYGIRNIEQGVWQVVIKANESTNYSLFSFNPRPNDTLNVSLSFSKRHLDRNESVGINVDVFDHITAISGSNTTANIIKPDGSESSIQLIDLGNGTNSNIFSDTSLPGTYRIFVKTDYPKAGMQFVRSGRSRIFVDAFPDLSINSLTASNSSVEQKDKITIIANVSNFGNLDENKTRLTFYDTDPDGVVTQINSSLFELNINSSALIFTQFSSSFIGNHTISAIVTIVSDIDSNFSNNILSQTVEVNQCGFCITSPSDNSTFAKQIIPVSFNINFPANWTGYSLDNSPNVTINTTDFTLSLKDIAFHQITIFANDSSGKTFKSDKVTFRTCTGDVNGDGKVDIVDIASVGANFGKKSGDLGFNPDVDVNDDGVVDIIDFVTVVSNFDKSCTIPVIVSILSPQNATYNNSSIPLTFSINNPTTSIAYSLDGHPNITISGNTTLTNLTAGPHNVVIFAVDFAGSTGISNKTYFTVNLTVKHTTNTVVSCSPSTVVVGQSITCFVTVTDTSGGTASIPTGTVTFTSSGAGSLSSSLCTLSGTTSNSASCTVSYTPTGSGTHMITVTYNGDTTHSASSGIFTVTVNKRTTTTTVNCVPQSVTVGSSTTCTAAVTDTSPAGITTSPTGTVSFISSGAGTFTGSTCTLVSQPPNSASCSVTYTRSATGPQTITGSYNGDVSHSASSGTMTIN